MVKVPKSIFLEMFQLKILNGNKKENKEWSRTCPNKPARHKTRYVHQADYEKYLKAKNINPS